MRSGKTLYILLLLGVFAPGSLLSARLKVFVSIPPQLEFVRMVGGDRVDVEVLLGQGQNPHAFDPSPRTVARLGGADLLFLADMPYEKALVDRAGELFSGLTIIDVNEGIELRHIDGGHGHGHGDDPHTWLDPLLVKSQIGIVCNALEKLAPEYASQFRDNRDSYSAKLDSLHNQISPILEPYRGRKVYVYHPSFGYFLESFGLYQQAVERGGHEPSARELASLIEEMRAEDVRTLFVQPEFPSPVADALSKSLDCRVVRLDPLAENYIDNMGKAALAVVEAMKLQDHQQDKP